MTLVLDMPDAWRHPLGLDTDDAPRRAREMIVLEGYREGRLSRGQLSEMLKLTFHDTERFLHEHGAEQSVGWDELEQDGQALRTLLAR